MPKGLSETGFELKRLNDILEEQRILASSTFQDLVTAGDVVDTSDSSTIGRLINLFAPAYAKTWEQLQLLYSAFDPNTAAGVALDNIVQYGGLTRNKASFSLVSGLFRGNQGITIPLGSVVGSELHPNVFSTTAPIVLNLSSASEITVQVSNVANTTNSSITYTVSSVSSNTVSYTSDASATAQEILSGLKSIIDSSHPILSASIEGSNLVITKVNVFEPSTFSVSNNLSVAKVAKIGNLQADEVGRKQASANSLSVIKTPVLGWDSVVNPLQASLGSEAETDEELRLRFRNSKFIQASNILDAMYSEILNVEGVDSLAIYENDTDLVDANGLPPHSFNVVVLGGESEVIAETIRKNKPTGITSVGNVSVEIIDSQDFPRDINFTRPSPVTVYVAMTLETNGLYPADGADQIRSAIIEYARQEFSVGDSVIYSRLYTPINSIEGHQVNTLFIGTSPNPISTSNILIDFDEISSFSSINITVNTV